MLFFFKKILKKKKFVKQQCAQISKNAGGIGLAVHCIRSAGAYIRGTNGVSNGLVPMLRVFNNTARYVDQGGGKRKGLGEKVQTLFFYFFTKKKGSFAIYLEPWHSDIFEFLDLRKNHGTEEERARDLFLGLWIPDLFMQRVKSDGIWSLMCPNECKGLFEVWGKEFEELYINFEKKGKFRKQVKARELWSSILQSQIETGTPYMVYKDTIDKKKDHCNRKSNQKNLGTIKSSNLCTEIVEYTSPDEVAVCNLASIALPKFVDAKSRKFDLEKLVEVTKVVTKNLNKVIDVNFYPVKEAEVSNLKHRPIGIGVQGLADVFILMQLPFESKDALQLNREIFEAIYFGAVSASCELAEKFGPYESYKGSPASKGELQFDMWGVTPSEKWNWKGLKEDIEKHGILYIRKHK
ncbi:hypothetical protein RFI_00140 [Reticulomyxa filosa]|uniref:Ribonucleotide reductase large subunit C-terminal domain-containing protein n=1 Tax=Reticulomyxa filosa TaxID=46433 RepID=X6PFR3_RETFI|nr:hypothetical protein RFI_00140 [Reticulomyxa filosa]|eukprot:ETO36923.1 hypothetical protein RFI_00140 [Reticulomyxa filosa]